MPLLDEPNHVTESERDLNDGLTVEMTTNGIVTHPDQIATYQEITKTNEDNRGLPVETTIQTSVDKTKKKENNNKNKPHLELHPKPMTNEELDNQDNETKNDNNKDSEDSTVSEAALGLIMLQEHDPTGNSLLQKYDNSSLLPVDAARQVDYSINPDAELAHNDNNTSHDSDDTIVLQHEIEDTIGETTDNCNTNTPSPTKTRHDTDLPVEMTGNNATLDTSSITKGLSNLTVSPSSAPQTPVSPNKGTVVFKSYRLPRRTANTDNKTSSRPTSANTAIKPNSENDIQLARIPSGILQDHPPR